MTISGQSDVDRAFAQHRDWVMSQPGMNSAAVIEEDGEKKIWVGGQAIDPQTKTNISGRVNVPVKFEETGNFKAYAH